MTENIIEESDENSYISEDFSNSDDSEESEKNNQYNILPKKAKSKCNDKVEYFEIELKKLPDGSS